ncbi:hypothetical protein [Microvirga sp. M2]|uniref:hypothetical protein n=1 Tax=Microvirga sp. M2 TaxID=3073270 RepID=UPI0039C00B34
MTVASLSKPAPLIWTDRISTGMSYHTYFGSRTPGNDIVYVLRTDLITDNGSVERWEVCWNTGCYPRRIPEARYHATLWAAIEAAEAEVATITAQPKQPCRACGPFCDIWREETKVAA